MTDALFRPRAALVTGASSGIGRAVARALAARGVTVRAVARRAERLADLAAEAPSVVPCALDLTDRAALYAALSDLEVDVLVNNAGVARGFDGLAEAAPDDIEATLGVNVAAMMHVLRAVLPGMIERRRGHVITLGSVSGLYPTASAVYGGAKAAAHMLHANLRLELRGTGIRATEICPGRVETEIYDAAFDDPALTAKHKEIGIRALAPDDVAGAVLYALDQPPHVNVAQIEITPTEQTYGGMNVVPASGGAG